MTIPFLPPEPGDLPPDIQDRDGLLAGTGLSVLHSRTQGNIEDYYRDQVQSNSQITGWSDQVFSGLEAAKGLPWAILSRFTTQVFQNFEDIAEDFEEFIDSLGPLGDFLTGNWEQITENTGAIQTLNTLTAAMGTTQAYVGDLQDLVTVPRANLAAWGEAPKKSVDLTPSSPFLIAGGGTVKNTCCGVFYPGIQSGLTTGDIIYTPIIVDRVAELAELRWIVGADTTIFSVDYYEVALCGYNPSNGNIEKIWGSGDIKSAEASTTTLEEVSINMGLTGQMTSPGQILFFAHQQVAPGGLQQARAMAAAQYCEVGRPSSLLLDGACYIAPAYSQGIPSSISLSSLTRENRIIPWGAVSVA